MPLLKKRLLVKHLITLLIVGITCLYLSSGFARTSKPDPELLAMLSKAAHETDSFKDRFDAEVWLMDMSARLKRRMSDDRARIELLKNVHYEATRADLPPELVLAVIETESNFNRWAISVVGAQGLMQVMPFWLEEIGRPDDRLVNIETNLRMGCTILRYYYDMESGDWIRALGRYNGSLGSRRYPEKVLERLRSRWFRQ